MSNFVKFLLDLLFPITCLGCDRPNDWLCDDCFNNIKINGPDRLVIVDEYKDVLTGVYVVTEYNQLLLQKALHNYKYNFILNLGDKLADLLIRFLQECRQDQASFDLVIPVPLAARRLIWRDFNQSEVLAEKISRRFGWRLETKVLFRKYYNRPQVGLNVEDRRANVRDSFEILDSVSIKDAKVLLIDDVLTTGSTMGECAKVLKNNGAKEIWGLVIAKS